MDQQTDGIAQSPQALISNSGAGEDVVSGAAQAKRSFLDVRIFKFC